MIIIIALLIIGFVVLYLKLNKIEEIQKSKR
jgi:hypothetical protein